MSTYIVVDGHGNSVADGLQDLKQAEKIAKDWATSRRDVAVVYDRATTCTEECVGEACEHEVFRADGS